MQMRKKEREEDALYLPDEGGIKITDRRDGEEVARFFYLFSRGRQKT